MKRTYNSQSKENRGFEYYVLFIAYSMSLIFLIGMAVYVSTIRESEINKTARFNIYSLKSRQNLSGSFFLGSGRIRTTDYYYFFVKDDAQEGYVKEKVRIDETILIEKDTVPALVKNYLEVTKGTTIPILKSFLPPKTETIEYNNFFGRPVPPNIKYKYRLIVPPGTVTENQVWEAL